jgi:hypothetical protein
MKFTLILATAFLFSFSGNFAKNWYICSDCCRTKNADTTPWENGCKKRSSGMHNFYFVGAAGDYNYTCRNCDAEVYLTSSSSPAASNCCGSGSTHNWYHK